MPPAKKPKRGTPEYLKEHLQNYLNDIRDLVDVHKMIEKDATWKLAPRYKVTPMRSLNCLADNFQRLHDDYFVRQETVYTESLDFFKEIFLELDNDLRTEKLYVTIYY